MRTETAFVFYKSAFFTFLTSNCLGTYFRRFHERKFIYVFWKSNNWNVTKANEFQGTLYFINKLFSKVLRHKVRNNNLQILSYVPFKLLIIQAHHDYINNYTKWGKNINEIIITKTRILKLSFTNFPLYPNTLSTISLLESKLDNNIKYPFWIRAKMYSCVYPKIHDPNTFHANHGRKRKPDNKIRNNRLNSDFLSKWNLISL